MLVESILGCMDETACNYNLGVDTDDGSCAYLDGICETCEDGEIIDNDIDDDGVCDIDEETKVTVFLFENCPVSQYMCGPLRDAYWYFCDTLNEDILFQGFSPNSFSTEESIENFVTKYQIPFPILIDYNLKENTHGPYTEQYLPIVTPEVFVELNGELVYRGMIDNSYQTLGEWSPPTEDYLVDILTSIVNEEEITYFETEAVGCLIN